MTRALLLGLALLAAGCAFRRGDPLPADPPADFSLDLAVGGVEGWPWDGRLRLDAAGATVDYDVVFPGPPPAGRRGCDSVDAAALREVWAAAVGAGVFEPGPAQEGELPAGSVAVEGRALGRLGRVRGEPAAVPALAALLEAIRRAVPPRILRAPPVLEPQR